jgi:TrmH family RNA methyltransferase
MNEKLPNEGIIILGNEANGISSKSIEKNSQEPNCNSAFWQPIQKTESLNVATATAIVLSEFRRNVLVEM